MTEPSNKTEIDHLFTNVLKLDANDIKALTKAGIKLY